MTLGASTTVTTNGSAVTFGQAVNAATDGGQSLTINTTNTGNPTGTGGVVTFNADVGSGAAGRLGGINITAPVAAGSITQTIITRNVTTALSGLLTGDQFYSGNVTFHSTLATNGGSFRVSGTTTEGNLGNNALVVNTGTSTTANVTFNGPINGTAQGLQTLTVNNAGTTTFASSVGGTVPLASVTTDAAGSSVVGGSITVAGPAPTQTTQLITIGDALTTTAPVTFNSTNGGQIAISSVNSAAGQLSLNTSGSVNITAPAGSTIGATGAPLVFVTTPAQLGSVNPITLTIASPGIPTTIATQGSQVSSFVGGSGSATTLSANAASLTATATVSSVQGTAAAAVSEAAKAGFDTDSVAQQINYGFAGDVGVAPPFEHRIGETGVSVPDGFGEDEDTPPVKG